MGRPSTVDRLPENVCEALHGRPNDPATTREEATQRTNALPDEVVPGHRRVSCRAVSHNDRKFREVTRRPRGSCEVASRMTAEPGTAPGGEMGRLLTETVRTVSFRITAVIRETDLGEEAISGLLKQLKDLSPTSQRVQAAGTTNEQRGREVREPARREGREEAASVAGSAATAEGIRREVLGIPGVAGHSVAARAKPA